MTDDTITKLIAGLIATLIGLAMFAGMLAFQGTIASYFWQWFFVPLGARPITICHAMGIVIAVRTIFWSKMEAEQTPEEMERQGRIFGAKLMVWSLAFGIGYLLSFAV